MHCSYGLRLCVLLSLAVSARAQHARSSINPRTIQDQAWAQYMRKHPGHVQPGNLLGHDAATRDFDAAWERASARATLRQEAVASHRAETSHDAKVHQRMVLPANANQGNFRATPAVSRVDVRQGFAKPDWTYYHTCDQVHERVRELVNLHPSIFTLQTVSKAMDGYSAILQVVTVELGDRSVPEEDKLRIMLNFGQHGREIITSDVALRLLEILALGAEKAAAHTAKDAAARTAIETVLRNAVIVITPMENVGGRRLFEGGKLCERKTAHGVDTNRNWPVDWGVKAPDYDPTEEYPGVRALSEPEVVILHELLQRHTPHAWVNVHSGMEALFMPYDHKAMIPDGENSHGMLTMLQALSKAHCPKCAVGSGGKSVGYLAHGTATDYIYDVLKVPIVFTWEIWGDMQANSNDCHRMFNPVTKESHDVVVENWASAFFTLFSLMPKHPAVPHHLVTPVAVTSPPAVAVEKQQAHVAAEAKEKAELTAEGVSEQLAEEISRYDAQPVHVEAARGGSLEEEEEMGLYQTFTVFLAGSAGGLLLSMLFARCCCRSRSSRRKARYHTREIPL